MDWGRLILEPYQLVPLQRIEQLPFPRLLLADDTGLGKTAEAGLILFRLMQRRRADRVLVLCRAESEPERWRDEMREQFGIDFTIINDGADYARLRRDIPSHLNVFGHLSRVAMSMYFAAPSKRGTHIVDDLRKVRWDVVVIDEAHHVAVAVVDIEAWRVDAATWGSDLKAHSTLRAAGWQLLRLPLVCGTEQAERLLSTLRLEQ